MSLPATHFVPLFVPKLCGVYALLDGDEVIYIGQSNDVHGRVVSHRATGKVFTGVQFMVVAEEDLDAYEGALIRALKPRLNKAGRSNGSRDAEVLAALGLTHLLAAQPEPQNEPTTEFGRAIRRLRTEHDMSMTEFGAAVGASSGNVSDWEQGVHGATLSRIQKIARVFGVEPAVLVNAGIEKKNPLGDTLKAYRRASNKSQAQIAAELGVSQPCVAKWEAGWIVPRDVNRVADAYGIDRDVLARACSDVREQQAVSP